MRTVQQLLETVRAREIELSPDGDRLHYRAPDGALDEDLKAELIQHKPEILAALKNPAIIYYEDEGERWIKTIDGRFWFEDKPTGVRTELIPGNPPEDTPLPAECFEAFGKLLGYIITKRSH